MSLRRTLGAAAATTMLASGLVAAAVASPVAPAPSASAASAFQCGTAAAPTVYATSFDAPIVYAVNPQTGAATPAFEPDPPLADRTLNQLALSPDGTRMFFTDGLGASSNVYMVAADGDATTPATLTSTPRGVGAESGHTLGGYDLATDRYVFGGASLVDEAGTSTVTVHSFDPATGAVAGNVATAVLEGAPGANGDLAFSPTGDMYVVAGGGTTFLGGNSSAQLYRVTGGVPTSGGPVTLQAEALGGRISNVRALSSIAFGADGVLYLGGLGVEDGDPNQLIRVDPANGRELSRTDLTLAGADFRTSDFATCASPSTVRGDVALDSARVNPADQFALAIRGAGIAQDTPGTTGVTAGSGAAIDGDGPLAGPVAVLAGTTATVTQTMAAGSVSTLEEDYATTWQCRDTTYNNAVLSSGAGSVASFTMPRQVTVGSEVDCTFTNRALVGTLELEKTVTSGTPTAIGEAITYGFTVTNTGEVTAAGVTLSDPALPNVTCAPTQPAVLAPGESMTCTGSRPTTAEDFAGDGPISNTAAVTATRPSGDPITATDTVDIVPDRTPPTLQPNLGICVPDGGSATSDVFGSAALMPQSVRFVESDGSLTTSVTVEGEGTWTVDETTGTITFTPEAGFDGTATPIAYSVAGLNGVRAQAMLSTECAQDATVDGDESDLGAPDPVTAGDDGGLPRTGGDIAVWVLFVGMALALAGAALWLIRRRRTADGIEG